MCYVISALMDTLTEGIQVASTWICVTQSEFWRKALRAQLRQMCKFLLVETTPKDVLQRASLAVGSGGSVAPLLCGASGEPDL